MLGLFYSDSVHILSLNARALPSDIGSLFKKEIKINICQWVLRILLSEVVDVDTLRKSESAWTGQHIVCFVDLEIS